MHLDQWKNSKGDVVRLSNPDGTFLTVYVSGSGRFTVYFGKNATGQVMNKDGEFAALTQNGIYHYWDKNSMGLIT